jgi:hypothetical protein
VACIQTAQCLLLANRVLDMVLAVLTCVHTIYDSPGFYSWRILADMIWWHLNNTRSLLVAHYSLSRYSGRGSVLTSKSINIRRLRDVDLRSPGEVCVDTNSLSNTRSRMQTVPRNHRSRTIASYSRGNGIPRYPDTCKLCSKLYFKLYSTV